MSKLANFLIFPARRQSIQDPPTPPLFAAFAQAETALCGRFDLKRTDSAGLSGCLGTTHVKRMIVGGDFTARSVAIWLGASTHGVAVALVTAITIAANDGDGGSRAWSCVLILFLTNMYVPDYA